MTLTKPARRLRHPTAVTLGLVTAAVALVAAYVRIGVL